jgi:hypothetical protein
MKRIYVFLGLAAVAGLFLLVAPICVSTGLRHGLWLSQCPDGELRQTVSVSAGSLARGEARSIGINAYANYVTGPNDDRLTTALSSFSPRLVLVGPNGETKLEPKKSWQKSGDGFSADVELPKVNDGDYLLRAVVNSSLGETTLDLPLPLYAPARIHVLTDRPLYEPGNTVKFRALALKGKDLTPLDGRPGRWEVRGPDGTVYLEEKAAAGDWGVVQGRFPLDRGADSGEWSVTWRSGNESDTRSFTVKPFTLPRFRLEASTDKPYYRRLEKPRLKGDVKYSSGAPVSNARVELTWNVSGDWPAPTAWSDGTALPREVKADAAGHFSVDLPAVPEDLQGQAFLSARLAAFDDSGDRVEGAASLLLSADAIKVSAITELEGGLVQGFNNRMYLRATTADGRVLEGVTLNVKRLWEARDKGTDAEADVDGVAALQVDPGPPVNVVIPPQPFRPPPPVKAVRRTELYDITGESDEASLADRLALDRLEGELAKCARYDDGAGQVMVGMRVSAGGAVQGMAAPSDRLGRCFEQVLTRAKLGAGKDRILSAGFAVTSEELSHIAASPEGVPVVPEELNEAFADALLDVRDCLPTTVPSVSSLPVMATWEYKPGSRTVPLSWVKDTQGETFPEGPLNCIKGRLTRLELPKRPASDEENHEEDQSAVGFVRFSVTAPEKYVAHKPRATVMTGYEFLVTAKKGAETIGSTKLRMSPGVVPPLRMRAASQQVKPGEKVKVELIRGPEFAGELPKKIYLHLGQVTKEFDFDAKTRAGVIEIPADGEGWASVQGDSAMTYLFIEPKAQLALAVKPEKERYAPGQIARLELETKLGGTGRSAAVGLFGVDDSLSQLVPLPGGDELSKLRPQAQSNGSFDGLDAAALSLGRIRGGNAVAATLLKVTQLPPPAQTDVAVSVSGSTVFDPNETLTDRFYAVLLELHLQARGWEEKSPPAERMTPRTMANLWAKAIDAVEAKKESARDGYGRKLRLHRLPADLLALTAPQAVIVQGTRLPEDVENWSAWVAKERP